MNYVQSLGLIIFTIFVSLVVFNGGRLMEHYHMQNDAVTAGAGHYASDTAEFKWGPADMNINEPMPDEVKSTLRKSKT